MAVSKSNPHNGAQTGSVIIDGTSYSGADIKVVVHLYDKEAATLEQQISDIRATIEGLNNKRSSLRSVSNVVDVGSRLGGLQGRINLLRDQLAFLERDLVEFGDIRLRTKVLTECQTLSISTYREKYPVRSISTVYPKSFTRGPRTIAGSMVFTVFDQNVLYELLDADASDYDTGNPFTSALIDQLPPFDITVSFANELGQTSRMAIMGVEFVSEGQVMSIQDMFIENTTQWVARDIDPMTRIGRARRDANNRITGQEIVGISATSLIRAPDAQKYIQSLNPFEQRFKFRNDPFK